MQCVDKVAAYALPLQNMIDFLEGAVALYIRFRVCGRRVSPASFGPGQFVGFTKLLFLFLSYAVPGSRFLCLRRLPFLLPIAKSPS